MQTDNKILVISGFSGAGKDTIAKLIKEQYGLSFVVSHSTRPMRPGESQGDQYYFISDNEMCTMAFNKELIEGRCYKSIYGNWFYAAHKDQIKQDKSYVVVLDVLGYRELKKHFGDRVVGIFIHVDDETRLERAKSRQDFNIDEWNRRLKDDKTQFNLDTVSKEYNYIIDNIDLKNTIKQVNKVIKTIKSQELLTC